jgi:hypothetical protein
VAILRAVCPECGAGLKCSDPAGFTVGEKIDCPKCESRFAVRTPARPREEEEDRPRKKAVKASVAEDADEEDDRPRKKKRRRDEEEDDDRPRKKKRRRDDDERTGFQKYRSSPVRFIILGVLILVMLVLAFFLYQKWQREKANARSPIPITSQFLS